MVQEVGGSSGCFLENFNRVHYLARSPQPWVSKDNMGCPNRRKRWHIVFIPAQPVHSRWPSHTWIQAHHHGMKRPLIWLSGKTTAQSSLRNNGRGWNRSQGCQMSLWPLVPLTTLSECLVVPVCLLVLQNFLNYLFMQYLLFIYPIVIHLYNIYSFIHTYLFIQ